MISFKKKNKGEEVAGSATPESATKPETPAAPPKPKPKPDIFTLLLGLSVAALLIATVLLFLNFNAYGTNPFSGIPKT
ncbi:MAG: hypothetical protein LBQ50_03885 [Planctomycetaceae bacterium]|jgi:hypothetical protein|nr:hypothetical protein [Planctomycetaceae bacterium]